MPLTNKGQDILRSMRKTYGAKEAEHVLYASKNAGRISGIDAAASCQQSYLDACKRGDAKGMADACTAMLRGRTVR